MATYNLNNFGSQIVSRNRYSLTPSLSGQTDVFAFDITGDRIIGLNLHNISSGDDADLRLFYDSNGNGILDASDRQVASSVNSGNLDDSIRYSASTGTYFALVSRYGPGSNGSVFYDLDLSATYDVAALSGSLIARNNYSLTPTDNRDVFAFTLDSDRHVGLNLHDISTGDDADLRLFHDSNGNGIFDADDQQVASSLRGSNFDDVIDYSATAGTYFAQVSRYGPGSSGPVFYDLDLSSNYALGQLGAQIASRNGYNLSAADPRDLFEFSLNQSEQVVLNLHNISTGDDADLRLYRDSNSNGIFDSGDAQVASSRQGGNRDDIITYQASAGTYFAQVERYGSSNGDVAYDLDVLLPALNQPETLSGSLISHNNSSLSATNAEAVYAFTLNGDRHVGLNLHNISAGDDADLRLFRDSNGNGIFDADDQQVASSLRGSNLDDVIDYSATAGTYFAQVSRYGLGSIGSVSYDLDLSSSYALGLLGTQIVSRNGYHLSAADPRDLFEFSLGQGGQVVLNLHNISAGDDADLFLYADSNSNGIFDSDDLLVASSGRSGNADDVITHDAAAGTYFAQVSRYGPDSSGDVAYNLDVSLPALSNAEALSGSLIRHDDNSLSAANTNDLYTFTLDGDRHVGLNLHNISAGDDADLWLYRDNNGNGVLDIGDQQVASSLRGSNLDDVIDYSATAGTYFAQVSRYGPGSSSSLSYDLDLSSSYALGQVGAQMISRNNYSLNAADPSDLFEFSLCHSGQVVLNLHNISAGDDADLFLYADSNSNGIFDSNDLLVASAIRSGNADDIITHDANAGTYFAQVSRYGPGSNGHVTYDLDVSQMQTQPIDNTNVPETYRAFDASRTFALNSNPDADHLIYLDFDGHQTFGTPWNSISGRSVIDTPAYDTDGDQTTFSVAERETIWRIWQRVAEDFSPFNVNVTTERPSDDRLVRGSSSDQQWGIRAVIGGNGDWYARVDGVALSNSFTADGDVPTFIFEDNLALGDGNEISTAETISHEVGHTLGLEHDGDAWTSYYQGHGTGATSWAPIMGYSDFRSVTQWSRGEYRNADNAEDDQAIITGNNGFGYRTDDHGDSLFNASVLMVGGQAQTYGIIETNTDEDWFSFSTSGHVDLAINAFERGANLDVLARLYGSAGHLLYESNPLGSLSASFDVTVGQGDYFLSVTGTGTGDPSTGYSDYGSLGQYSISGAIA